MPLISELPGAPLGFSPSVVAEILFLSKTAAAGDAAAGEVPGPLARRVRQFWGDGVLYWELFVIAEAGGALTGPLGSDTLAERLKAGIAAMDTNPALASESERDQQVVRARLVRLAKDRRLAARYVKLLSQLWAVFEPEWRRRLPVLERVAEECRRRSELGTSWQGLVKGPETAPEIQQAAWERARSSGATIAICAFGGSLVIDLPHTQFFALTARSGGGLDRNRAEELSRRARSLADPTRLGLIRLLALEERGVGELASALGVSQPTVSNHVKQLREVGLLTSPNESGDRRRLQLQREALERLLAEIGRFAMGG